MHGISVITPPLAVLDASADVLDACALPPVEALDCTLVDVAERLLDTVVPPVPDAAEDVLSPSPKSSPPVEQAMTTNEPSNQGKRRIMDSTLGAQRPGSMLFNSPLVNAQLHEVQQTTSGSVGVS